MQKNIENGAYTMSRLKSLFQQAQHDNNKHAFSQLKEFSINTPHDTLALNLLGRCYLHGYGVSRNPRKAADVWKRGAALGNEAAMCNLGALYANQNELTSAAQWLLAAAKSSADKGSVPHALDNLLELAHGSNPNPSILTSLAICYEYGYSVEQDIDEALKYYRRAAELGDDVAMCNIGLLYLNGHGVQQNILVAESWFQEAAKKQTNNPSGSLRAEKQLAAISIDLANFYFQRLTENAYTATETVITLQKLDKQHRLLLQKDAHHLLVLREELQQRHPHSAEIGKISKLITHLQSVLNYPCCVNMFIENKHAITSLLGSVSIETQHLKTFIEQASLINHYNAKLKSALSTIKNAIDNPLQPWLAQDLFGNFKPGMPAGIKKIKNILEAVNANNTHDVYDAFLRIITILNAKNLQQSARRHPLTTRFYNESLMNLENVHFNQDIVDNIKPQSISKFSPF